MSVSRRHLLLGSSSALFLTACGGGGGSDATTPTPTPTQKIEWDVVSRGPENYVLAGVTYKKNLLVARGSNGVGTNGSSNQAMSYSEDGGDSWTAVQVDGMDDFSSIQDVAFGRGRWLAVATRGEVITSSDGKTWSIASRLVDAEGDRISPWSVTFGNDVFVVQGETVGGTPFSWATADGLTWTDPRPLPLSFGFSTSKFIDGSFYCFGYPTLGIAEGDAAEWTTLSFTIDNVAVIVRSLALGNGIWVAVTEDGFVATSPDFAVWTVVLQVANARRAPYNVSFINGNFVLLVAEKIYTSTDGTAWIESVVGASGDSFYDVVFDGTRYVATGMPGLTATGTLV